MLYSEPTIEQTGMPLARVRQVFLALLLVLACVVLFSQFKIQMPRQWSGNSVQIVALDEQYYRVNQAQMAWLESFTSEHFSAGEMRSKERVEQQIDAQLDSLFARVNERLPLFADWYYSLSGEYSRMAMAVLSTGKLVEGDFVARKASEVLFPEPVWQDGLARLENDNNALVLAQQAQTRAAWLSEVQSLLSTQQVPAPIAGLEDTQQGAKPKPLDALLLQLDELDALSSLRNRVAVSSLGAAGLAGPALWRAVAARNALASARVVAAGSAAAGALLCAPGGPLAVACAAGAGVVTWLATDWLLLQLDEAWNREELLSHMAEALEDLRAGLQAELVTAYEARIAAIQSASQAAISQTFSPRTSL